MQKTRIIIPCFNEEKRLDSEAFLRITASERNLSLLFIDDGSTDGTLQLLRLLEEKKPASINVMSLEKNSGKAEAVRHGIMKSVDGPFDFLGYWDADLATPLSELHNFCLLLDSTDAEIVIGSRVRLLGRNIERSAVRHYLGRLFATCASLILKISIYDTQCGAKIFRNTETVRQVFSKPFKVKWIFDVEMLARFSIVNKTSPAVISSRWIELPLSEWIDVKGSKVKPKDFFNSFFEFCHLVYLLHSPARKTYEAYITQRSTR